MKRKSLDYKPIYRIFFLTILYILIFRIIYNFVFLKTGFHSDEVWSYGLANSYFEPFIYRSEDHSQQINFNQWIPGDVMKSYVTVDDSHRFAYDSVWFNQKYENHPPLYYAFLHTICSFFPGRKSLYYGLAINIIACIFTMIFLYKTVSNVTNNSIVGLICCFYYGLSIGALNTFVFVRMYALLTAISTASLYFHSRLYITNNFRKNMYVLILLTTSGILTHHFFIPYTAIVSVCFCLYYWLKKEYRSLFIYSFGVFISFCLSLLIFPDTISHLFSEKLDETKFTLSWQIALTFNCMFRDLFGFEIPVVPTISFSALIIIIGCTLVILSPVLYLINKSRPLKKVLIYLVNKLKNIRYLNLLMVVMFVSPVCICLLTAFTVSLLFMKETADRYLFFVYPLICGFTSSFCFFIFKFIFKRKKIIYILTTIVCLIFVGTSNLNSTCIYLFSKPDNIIPMEDVIADKNCIFITNESWMLTCFAWVSTNAKWIYAINSNIIKEESVFPIPESPDSDNNSFVIVDANLFKKEYQKDEVLTGKLPERGISYSETVKLTEEEFLMVLSKFYSEVDYIGHDYMFDREYFIYQVEKG